MAPPWIKVLRSVRQLNEKDIVMSKARKLLGQPKMAAHVAGFGLRKKGTCRRSWSGFVWEWWFNWAEPGYLASNTLSI